ncbi:unnamed protein product [Rhizophagus irregularis]|nr:unnamed protein product [Rhizophagus irregularis]
MCKNPIGTSFVRVSIIDKFLSTTFLLPGLPKPKSFLSLESVDITSGPVLSASAAPYPVIQMKFVSSYSCNFNLDLSSRCKISPSIDIITLMDF